MGEQAMVQRVREAGLKVTEVGTENGVPHESGDGLKRLLGSLRYVCEKAAALGRDTLMMPPGNVAVHEAKVAVTNLRTCADIAAGYGLKLALAFNSRHPIVHTLEAGLELVDAVDMKNCGLLIDSYHLQRGGGDAASFRNMPVERIVMFQFSDVPAHPPSDAPVAIDRLPPWRAKASNGCARCWHRLILQAEWGTRDEPIGQPAVPDFRRFPRSGRSAGTRRNGSRPWRCAAPSATCMAW